MNRRSADDDSLPGRVRRYARVSTSMAGVATRLGAKRILGVPLDRGRHAADLTRALGGVKGPLMKVAQLLATIPDALPREYAAELAQLQADAPAMGWPFVKRRMASELGRDWRQRFDTFETEAAAAASLGQVHRATDFEGRELACKLQYPDMGSAVEADLQQLKLIFAIYRRQDKAIETDRIHDEIAARLREELDYDLERRHMELYVRMLKDEAQVHVPVALPDLSTGRLLTMSWLDGEPLMKWTGRGAEERNNLALNMFRAWYVPFYNYGVIHGDPHLGNYSVRPDGAVNLLDYGCIRVFEAKFIGGVIDLYHALQNDDRDLVRFIESMGATVVIDDHCTGTKYIWEDVTVGEDKDLISAITNRYIAKPACPNRDVANPGRRHPAHVLGLARDWDVQGVIFIQEKFCDPHLWDFPVIEKVLKENGLPTLSLEVDVTTPVGQFRTRLEAFLETLESEVA